MSRTSSSEAIISLIVFLAILVFIGFKGCVVPVVSQGDVPEPIEVKRLEHVRGGGGKYLIYSEEGEVYENTDVLVLGKFHSSDIYGRMEEGACYKIRTEGFRFRLLSWYQNILEARQVDCPNSEGLPV